MANVSPAVETSALAQLLPQWSVFLILLLHTYLPAEAILTVADKDIT